MDAILRDLSGILLRAVPTFLLVIFLHFYLKSVFFGPMQQVLRKRYEATEGARKLADESLARAAQKTAEYSTNISPRFGSGPSGTPAPSLSCCSMSIISRPITITMGIRRAITLCAKLPRRRRASFAGLSISSRVMEARSSRPSYTMLMEARPRE